MIKYILNELQSFKRGISPTKALGLGIFKLVGDNLEKIDKKFEVDTINDRILIDRAVQMPYKNPGFYNNPADIEINIADSTVITSINNFKPQFVNYILNKINP